MGIFSKELNKDSKVLFLVTSAVNTLWGNSQIVRFTETVNTINSINANFNNADIWLLESGFKIIKKKYLDTLPKNVTVKSFSEDKNIIKFIKGSMEYSIKYTAMRKTKQSHKDNLKLTFLKNRTESYVFRKILNNENFKKYDRIFKLSGRYVLSPNFNIKLHDDNNYVFYKSIDTNQASISEKYSKIYPCFCWSMNGKKINEIKKIFTDLEKELEKKYENLEYMDIEHLLYDKIDNDKVTELNEIGIFANIGEKNFIYV
jgi:hypothetical protein